MTCEKTKYGIGWAVCMIKTGGAVRRTGWPKDAYLRLQFDNQRNRETGATVFFMQWRNMDKKTKDLMIKEWTATSDDLLATDWEAYESEGEVWTEEDWDKADEEVSRM